MSKSELHYITLCKKQIELRYSFGNGHGYTQRDLQMLSVKIEEKTGINISLSTLKRFWRSDFKQSPQMATLNALAALLEYNDWQDFKQANQNGNRSSKRWIIGVATGLTVIVVSFLIVLLTGSKTEGVRTKSPKVNGAIQFSAEKTVTTGIPNTVIFTYDVSNVEADSFFIQQSWNDRHRVRIDPNGSAFSSIYYESGYHRAWLIANDSNIAMQPIHILSNGWEPHIYYSESDLVPINFKNSSFIADGQLHLSGSLLEERQVDTSRYYFTRISNSQQFNVSSDNFTLTSRMKVDSVMNSLCPWMTMIMVTEKHIFSVSFQKKGCENYASYKLGEIVRSGEYNDLSALGCDIFSWQELTIAVRDKNSAILINGEPAFQETYKEDYGNIVGLIYLFEGRGSIDYVCLSNANGNIVFEDDFVAL